MYRAWPRGNIFGGERPLCWVPPSAALIFERKSYRQWRAAYDAARTDLFFLEELRLLETQSNCAVFPLTLDYFWPTSEPAWVMLPFTRAVSIFSFWWGRRSTMVSKGRYPGNARRTRC